MTIEDFADSVAEQIEKDTLYSVERTVVVKLNDNRLMGLKCTKEGTKVNPIIYLNELYKNTKGNPAEVDYSNLYKSLTCTSEQQLERLNNLGCLPNNIQCIYPRLISTELNTEFLQDKPSIPFLDYSIVFVSECENSNSDEVYSIYVTDSIMQINNWNEEQLIKQAFSNLNSIAVQYMDLDKVMVKDSFDFQELNADVKLMDTQSYVITLAKSGNIFGACCMLSNTFIDVISKLDKNTSFVLPSSIHECIVIANSGRISKTPLNEMVTSVNNSEVSSNEILGKECHSVAEILAAYRHLKLYQ